MKRLLWLFVIGGAIGIWHTFTGWYPPPTDGGVWNPSDSCTWVLAKKFPAFSENALLLGDKLHRIDYRKVCAPARIPPAEKPHQLFLYEISRRGEIHLVFVESLPAFPLGWPTSEVEYHWTLHLTLGILLMGAAFLLFTSGGGGFSIGPLPLLRLMSYIGAFSFLWLLWADRSGSSRDLWAAVAVSLWGMGALLHAAEEKLVWLGMLPLIILPFLKQDLTKYLTTEVLLGLPAAFLPQGIALLYAIAWGAWVVARLPLILSLLGALILSSYASHLRRTLRLLPLWRIGLSLSALGIGILSSFLGKSALHQLLFGGVGFALSFLLIEGGRRLFQARQQRVRLLEERLPLLWEKVERAELIRFAEETLRLYAAIEQMSLQKAEGKASSLRPWMRRTGEPPPIPLENLPFTPDVILPLPSYGWLLLKEGTYKLRPDDVQRLSPFAAGLSIALRHAELLEAAHEARLAALRGQLSPHFLFNALNTLQSLVGEDPALAEALMSRLGDLLRRSLSHARQMTVPLEEELALVRDYLAIEKQRFGERLKVSWKVPEVCPPLHIPPFSIQLLAENVIKHAVGRLTRPVQMEIAVTEETEVITIQVVDDGPGIDLSRLRQSVGLSNLIHRLEQLYHGEAQLLAERLNPGTRVTLIFPRRSQEQDAHTDNPAKGPSVHEK
ncbi:MAG: histidine kinase [Bacteroidia bacterium]|nr:histidine kinase [Bacteroidia bacterium]